MARRNNLVLILSMLVLLILACGQLDVGVMPATDSQTTNAAAPTAAGTSDAALSSQADIVKPTQAPEVSRLDCTNFDVDPLVTISCNIEASFISRNTQPLLGYMQDPFFMAFWQSEGMKVTPEYALDYFQQTLIPSNPEGLTFTVDREEFPALFGTPPETIFGPAVDPVLIIYSKGWGADGQGEVLIYISEHANGGGYYFPAILVALGGFDQ